MVEKNNNLEVEKFLKKDSQWKEEYNYLRELIVDFDELDEDYKWMHPCYTLENKNVVIIQDFKYYCALLFEKGSIMEDPYQSLIQQTKNVQAARQLRFESLEEVENRRDEIKWYVEEAISIEKSGKQVPMKKTADYEMPEELQIKLNDSPQLEEAFYNLTPGRQRQYMFHIGQAKRATTREKRVEKYVDHILEGKGIDDK